MVVAVVPQGIVYPVMPISELQADAEILHDIFMFVGFDGRLVGKSPGTTCPGHYVQVTCFYAIFSYCSMEFLKCLRWSSELNSEQTLEATTLPPQPLMHASH